MAEVTINYKDAAIATMDASGTKTLQTQGKYCDDDIEVVYARPSGGGGASMEDELVTGDFTSYTNDRVTSIRSQFFARMTNLRSVSFANVTSLPGERHFDRAGVSSLSMPKLTGTSSYMFNECQSLLNIPETTFPLVTSIGAYSFQNCQHLETADFPSVTQIATGAFNRCFLLTVLVLRANRVCSLANAGAFDNTPIRGRNGMNGTIYVPSSLVESYKTAPNWETIFSEGYLTFAAIEGSIYDT